MAAVEEIKERVLENLGPDFEVGEVGLAALLKWNGSQNGISLDKADHLIGGLTERPPITALAMLPMPD